MTKFPLGSPATFSYDFRRAQNGAGWGVVLGKDVAECQNIGQKNKKPAKAGLMSETWCPGEDSNLHSVATART